MAENAGVELGQAVAVLAAGVVAAAVFRSARLGTVLGYLGAGLVIGPFGLKLFNEPESIMHFAELGVVMLLFLIGLEMQPRKLWSLRKEIFGLGATQVLVVGALVAAAGVALGLSWPVAVVAGAGLALSSTAVITQVLNERGELREPSGQRSFSILLMEDIAIVPLLGLVALLAVTVGGDAAATAERPIWLAAGLAIAALAAVTLAGRFAINPLFTLLARVGARELMTAAALLVVLGAALVMQAGGLSMALGAFLAGVLLSESAFRHQLEADIEPFRGLLLGLFFISVGMSLNVGLVLAEWPLILAGVIGYKALKGAGVYVVARLFGADQPEAIRRTALFAQGGEFAFVLFGAALTGGLFDPRIGAILSAIVIVSMALTPPLLPLAERLARKGGKAVSMDGVEPADGLTGSVLLIGFGRFAQVVSQPLLARGVDIALIENDVEMIQAAAQFGFKVYYGDGQRLDVLRASGAENARMICVCVDQPDVADRIVELCKAEFPHALLYVRAFDRGHAIRLVAAGVDHQVRETFESAMAFGRAVLSGLGVDEDAADDTMADVRRRDEERMTLQIAGGIEAGRTLLRGNMVTTAPAPLVRPKTETKALNAEAEACIEKAEEEGR